MAVAFGSGGTYLTYGSHTNSTLVAPASIANGDLLIAYLAIGTVGTAPAPTAPAGWTGLTGSPLRSNAFGFDSEYYIFYKIASSESGNYTFTHSSANSCGVVIRYTGVDTSTPFSPTPTTNGGVDATATATGFTTTVANTFVIFTEQDFGDNTIDTVVPTGTTPTFTERLDAALLYIADGTLASAGATGNKSHTCNNNVASPWAAYLIGLNPAAGGGGAPVTLNANPGSYTLTGTPAALGRQIINIGAVEDDGTGDHLRVALDKCNRNFVDLYRADTTFLPTTTAAATYQPLDADLTAIAALTGTNTIYYRNAANSWAAVNVSTGLAFSGGNLTATGGGGDVFKASANAFTAQNTFQNFSVVIGHTAPFLNTGLELHAINTSAQLSAGIFRWSNDVNAQNISFLKSRGATVGSNAVVQSGDVLGEINFLGNYGSAFVTAATIRVFVNGTPSGSMVPGAFQLYAYNTAGVQVQCGSISPDACNFIGSIAAVPAGYVGEYLSASASSVACGAGAYTATATLAIPAGDWDIRGVVRVNGTAGSYMYCNVYTAAGSSSGSPDDTQTGIFTGLGDVWTAVGPFRRLLTTSTTYRLNIYMAIAGTLVFGEIQARRRH